MTAWIARLLLSVAFIATAPADPSVISHILERTSFGARPGDADRVRSIGVNRYIDEQLHPEQLTDAAVDARLSELQTLRMSSRQIAAQFEVPLEEARKAAAAAGGDGQPD